MGCVQSCRKKAPAPIACCCMDRDTRSVEMRPTKSRAPVTAQRPPPLGEALELCAIGGRDATSLARREADRSRTPSTPRTPRDLFINVYTPPRSAHSRPATPRVGVGDRIIDVCVEDDMGELYVNYERVRTRSL